MKKILDEVLLKITPSKEEIARNQKTLSGVLKTIAKAVRPARAELGGSGAKGTFLAGQFDMDIFILYPYTRYKDRSAELSELLEGKLSPHFKNLERIHGSRDYFRATIDGTTFEIIPILDIKNSSQAKNITDVSPLHSKWVRRNARKGMHAQIRLAKAFCKGAGVYGAESYIRGFSGYVCEILTIKYGSFAKLLRASQKWVPGDTIDVARKLKGRPAFSVLNKSKLLSPIIVIDPVQENRNAAAALSIEAYATFRATAKAFLAKPATGYFFRTFLGESELRKKYKAPAVVVKVKPLDAKEDVAGTAMHKSLEYLRRKSAENGFALKSSDWEWDKKGHAFFWLVPTKAQLPPTVEHLGPPLRIAKHAAAFKKQYRTTSVKKGRLVAIVAREHRTLKSLIASLVKNDAYVKVKAQKYEIL